MRDRTKKEIREHLEHLEAMLEIAENQRDRQNKEDFRQFLLRSAAYAAILVPALIGVGVFMHTMGSPMAVKIYASLGLYLGYPAWAWTAGTVIALTFVCWLLISKTVEPYMKERAHLARVYEAGGPAAYAAKMAKKPDIKALQAEIFDLENGLRRRKPNKRKKV